MVRFFTGVRKILSHCAQAVPHVVEKEHKSHSDKSAEFEVYLIKYNIYVYIDNMYIKINNIIVETQFTVTSLVRSPH